MSVFASNTFVLITGLIKPMCLVFVVLLLLDDNDFTMLSTWCVPTLFFKRRKEVKEHFKSRIAENINYSEKKSIRKAYEEEFRHTPGRKHCKFIII